MIAKLENDTTTVSYVLKQGPKTKLQTQWKQPTDETFFQSEA